MAADESTDIIMMIKVQGQAMPAEGQSDLFQADFDSDNLLNGFDNNKFFNIEDINLGFGTSNTTSQSGKADNAVDAQPLTITRQIDSASPALMNYCITATTLDSAAIVKRRAAGADASGLAYMRIDLTGVLITKVNWSDSHVVKETITMVYREISFTYRPQTPSGALAAAVNSSWGMFS